MPTSPNGHGLLGQERWSEVPLTVDEHLDNAKMYMPTVPTISSKARIIQITECARTSRAHAATIDGRTPGMVRSDNLAVSAAALPRETNAP